MNFPAIQQSVLVHKYSLAWSYVLDYEIERSPFRDRQERFLQWKNIAVSHCNENETVLQKAEELQKGGLQVADSLHIACAIQMNCDCFLTTDDHILNRALEEIAVLNPLEFIERETL